MSWVDDAIREFGDSLGIPDLAFNRNGVVSLNVQNLGSLNLERTETHVLVYLVRPLPPHDDKIARKALTLCHYREGHPYPVSAGIKGEEALAFLLRIPEREFSLPVIERCVETLGRLHDSAAS